MIIGRHGSGVCGLSLPKVEEDLELRCCSSSPSRRSLVVSSSLVDDIKVGKTSSRVVRSDGVLYGPTSRMALAVTVENGWHYSARSIED